MFKTILFAGALAALSSISSLGCTDADLGEDTSELTGFCIRGETCRQICFPDLNGQVTCHQLCSLDIGPCDDEGGGGGSGGGGDGCEDDDDNPPDLCGGGGSRVP
jgi:hypothetical protein